MEVPAWDYGLVLDEDDNIDILRSPFFDVGFDFDNTVEEYFDQIHITLVDTIDDQRTKGRWTILGRLTTASLPDTPPFRGYFPHLQHFLTYTIGKQVAAIRQRLLSGGHQVGGWSGFADPSSRHRARLSGSSFSGFVCSVPISTKLTPETGLIR
ncbi:hypothetical protein IEQ34_016054 [Dendrobium chrysotoxum]|uniref:Uncharacterized protein n=1 Tax=Dendrobium chrysotoxum TaxID=161865 RepID=A0AAV7GEH7_DENCH|nr:hypothetical protein IEQ34_016054 [Dendrobium chrysotoxum]